jgi:hypothetical protein
VPGYQPGTRTGVANVPFYGPLLRSSEHDRGARHPNFERTEDAKLDLDLLIRHR